ncbi:hypothetical protein FRC17_004839 [Serendipita sp. 399]|nr:hypothetical protein FRC17_004839 [Serendipita sp. 399]
MGPLLHELTKLGILHWPEHQQCKPSGSLPIEVWEIIIEFAIDIPECFGTDCRPEDLPHFISDHCIKDIPGSTLDPYQHSRAIIAQLRLISRTWNQILEQKSRRWQSPFDRRRPLHPLVRRVDIALRSEARSKEAFGFDREQELLALSSPHFCPPNLSVLVILDSSPQPAAVENRINALCQNQPRFLETVKSLSYATLNTGISPTALSRLSTSFASLTSFILNAQSIEGKLFLPQLYTLAIVTESSNLSGWQCPNLRHFSFSSKRSIRTHIDAVVPLQFSGLQALIVQPLSVELNSHFWSRHPHLQLFGCSMMTMTDIPLRYHPLKHIYISKVPYSWSPQPLSAIFGQIGGKASGRIFYVDPPKPADSRNRYWGEWRDLYAMCQSAGITWRPISQVVDPEAAWAPLTKDDQMGKLELFCVRWSVEFILSLSLAITYRIFPTVVLDPIEESWRFWEFALVTSAFPIYRVILHISSDIPISS